MEMSLITQLKILKLSKIKPNFSKLAREYEIDRRTVKKYYDGYNEDEFLKYVLNESKKRY